MGTRHKELFDRAYARMIELHGEGGHTPDLRIVSRFYHEKAHLQGSDLYMGYLDFARRMQEAIAMTWYKIHFKKQYSEIMCK